MMDYKLWLTAILFTTILACEVSDEVEDLDDDVNADNISFVITNYRNETGIYDTLLFRGSFSENLPEPKITIKGDSDFELDFISASTTELYAFIPKNVAPGDYELVFTVGENEISSSTAGSPINITMQDRPLITNISSKTFAAGTEITVKGGSFINTSGNNGKDATVWFMKTGYTNTVSDITVNEAGDEATFLVDNDLEPGTYDLHVTVGESSTYYTEWSNLVVVTVQ